MIRVVAKIFVEHDKQELFISAAKELISKSRLEEGCHFYDLMRQSENKNILCFIEEWASHSALEQHMSTEHFKKGIQTLEQYWTKAPSIEVYEMLN